MRPTIMQLQPLVAIIGIVAAIIMLLVVIGNHDKAFCITSPPYLFSFIDVSVLETSPIHYSIQPTTSRGVNFIRVID